MKRSPRRAAQKSKKHRGSKKEANTRNLPKDFEIFRPREPGSSRDFNYLVLLVNARFGFSLLLKNGGEGEIRTHGSIATTYAFQAYALNHSATSPQPRTLVNSWG